MKALSLLLSYASDPLISALFSSIPQSSALPKSLYHTAFLIDFEKLASYR